MTKKIILLSLATSATLFAQSELAELQAQIQQQIHTTQALQKRLAALEKKEAARKKADRRAKQKAAAKREQEEMALTEKEQESQTPAVTFDQKSFLPDIALILDGSAVSRNVNNSTYESYYIPGFSSYNPNEEKEIPFNKNRGFNFNYAELSLHSTVGPYFDADAIFHLQSDSFETEEAYITSRSMPYGLRAKMGKFRSEFGRINAMHQHAWTFTSQPLVFNAMFGCEGVNDAGIQLQWVLPTDTYIMAGVEALQGSNDISFGATEKDNLYIGYIKSSFDPTDSTTILAGISLLHGKNVNQKYTNIYAGDLTVKTALDSYSSLMWQSEMLYRNYQNYQDTDNDTEQAGYYTQLVYQYNQNWTAGIRYDSLFKNLDDQPNNLDKYSALLTYKPFEFTKFRLQYSYDRSKAFGNDEERKNVSEILLEFTIEAGAHGAHAF